MPFELTLYLLKILLIISTLLSFPDSSVFTRDGVDQYTFFMKSRYWWPISLNMKKVLCTPSLAVDSLKWWWWELNPRGLTGESAFESDKWGRLSIVSLENQWHVLNCWVNGESLELEVIIIFFFRKRLFVMERSAWIGSLYKAQDRWLFLLCLFIFNNQ